MRERAPDIQVDDDLKDIGFVRTFFGGTDKPLDPSTVYRWIGRGLIPPPEDTGKISRWRLSKLREARQRIFDRAKKPSDVV
jgi:hypothetical protein